MHALRHLLFHNWFLKLLSLILAAVLWMTVASESTSEIAIEVPLEYRNVPADSEVTGDAANTVEVRLRGPSSMIREIQSQDVSSTIDVASLGQTETIVPLTAQNISAPFGIEVVGVTPTRVRLTVEKTVTKTVPVVAVIVGEPADGFRVIRSSVMPASVEIHGPETRVHAIAKVHTTMIDVSAQKNTVQTIVELDPEEPLVRIPRIGPIHVEVVIGPQ